VMERAVRAKLAAAPSLRSLLLATHPHPLLSIKPDRMWGFDPRSGGETYSFGSRRLVHGGWI